MFFKNRLRFFERLILPLFFLFSGLYFTSLIVLYDYQIAQNEEKELAIEYLHRLSANIEQTFHTRLSIIIALEAFVQSHQHFDLNDPKQHDEFGRLFKQFTDLLDERISGILSMQLAPNGVVTFVTQEERNRQAIGHNLLIDDTRREQVLESIRQRTQITAGPLTLIQGGDAIISRQAVFTQAGIFSPQQYLSQKQIKDDTQWLQDIPSDFWGMATILIDTEALYRSIGLYNLDNRFRIAIRGRHGLGMEGDVFWGNKAIFDNPLDMNIVTIPGGTWVVAIQAVKPLNLWRTLIIALMGVLLTGFAVYAVLIQRANNLVIAKNQAKSDFLSRMSHEFRTPLNAILGFAQLLELDTDDLTEDQQENVHEILIAGEHLLNLVNEVLDLSKIEANKLEFFIEKVSVNDVVKQCCNLVKHQAQKRQLKIIDRISHQEYYLNTDIKRLKQIMLNLMSNAIKYNREQGQIILEAKVINHKRLRIFVTDTGHGIAEHQMPQLFAPFERLNPQAGIDGTGIGLTITKLLVERMGGILGVESTLGKGSTFWFELPFSTSK